MFSTPHDPPPNRLDKYFPVDPVEVPAPVPSALDKLLSNCHEIKLSLLRWQDDDNHGGVDECISFAIRGTVDDDATLASLMAQFRTTPRGTEGAA